MMMILCNFSSQRQVQDVWVLHQMRCLIHYHSFQIMNTTTKSPAYDACFSSLPDGSAREALLLTHFHSDQSRCKQPKKGHRPLTAVCCFGALVRFDRCDLHCYPFLNHFAQRLHSSLGLHQRESWNEKTPQIRFAQNFQILFFKEYSWLAYPAIFWWA